MPRSRSNGTLSWLVATLVVGFTAACSASHSQAQERAKTREQAVQKAIDFLRTKGQADDGSFSASASPAITALVTGAILRNGRTVQDPTVAKGLGYLEKFVQPDGGIYKPGSRHRNYETCVALVCFSEANADGRYAKLIKNADDFLKKGQWDESEGVERSNITYGGAGYGQADRPDLSNTAFLVEALKTAGDSANDEAMQRALVFISRCQNLETQFNTTPFAAKNPDGGFYYTPAAGGASMAGKTDDGGLRSYASMSYSGLKSMIYCGVDENDPRVKAAIDWAHKHYTLDENPGMADAGLYYYYQVFAKALSALRAKNFTDAKGKEHDWRAELIAALIARQQEDGSWVNKNARWMEGDPNLVTGYALLALSYCKE